MPGIHFSISLDHLIGAGNEQAASSGLQIGVRNGVPKVLLRSRRYLILAKHSFSPDPADHRCYIAPSRFVGSKLPPQERNELGKLVIVEAVLERWHVAEIAKGRLGDAMQDQLDQIVGPAAVQVAVERQRWPAAEQAQPADFMADGTSALVEARSREDATPTRVRASSSLTRAFSVSWSIAPLTEAR